MLAVSQLKLVGSILLFAILFFFFQTFGEGWSVFE